MRQSKMTSSQLID